MKFYKWWIICNPPPYFLFLFLINISMLRDYGGKNTRSMRNISVALSLVWDHILQNTLGFFNVPGIKKYVSCCL